MAETQQFAAMVAHLESLPEVAQRRVSDIPELASWRFVHRGRLYRFATTHFALSIFNAICALAQEGWSHWLSLAAFCIAFVMMIRCELLARTMSRQLHRPAAVQLARDWLRIKG